MNHRNTYLDEEAHSCSTFMLKQGDDLFVGHNLDDYIEVPGLVVVNKRGVSKVSTSWDELISKTYPLSTVHDRLQWTSQYGSLTYNTRGRECIDGGMNETGLYIGEMTLWGTEYPEVPNVPKMCQVLWMQYLLDCCETVSDVVVHLDDVQIDGTCMWHFFVSDRDANSAVIEFFEKKTTVYTGSEMPVPLLCNDSYQNELKRLRGYVGFGGEIPINRACEGDMRFVWGAQMFTEKDSGDPSSFDRAWTILDRLKGDKTNWGIIFDVRNCRMYFRTNEAPQARFVDFDSFDFSPTTPVLILDINEDLAGEVSNRFEPFTHARNKEFIAKLWNGVDFGEEFNTTVRPRLIDNSARFIEMLDART